MVPGTSAAGRMLLGRARDAAGLEDPRGLAVASTASCRSSLPPGAWWVRVRSGTITPARSIHPRPQHPTLAPQYSLVDGRTLGSVRGRCPPPSGQAVWEHSSARCGSNHKCLSGASLSVQASLKRSNARRHSQRTGVALTGRRLVQGSAPVSVGVYDTGRLP